MYMEEVMEKIRTLLVDDSSIDLTLAKFHLEGAGLEVETAKDGFEALDRLSKKQYDLFVVDLMMPKMGGFDLITRIKAQAGLKETPVIVLSAKSGVFDIKRVLKLGVSEFIVKPISPDILKNKIKTLFQDVNENWEEVPLNGGADMGHAIAVTENQIEIVSLGEQTMTVKSQVYFEESQFVKLNSSLLSHIEISHLQFVVSSFLKVGKDYYTKLKFDGIGEEDKEKIRFYLRSERTYSSY